MAKFVKTIVYGCDDCPFRANLQDAHLKEPFRCTMADKTMTASPRGVFPKWCPLEEY
jgi:hypothetical protein